MAYGGTPLLDQPPRRHGVRLVAYGQVHENSRVRVQALEGITYASAYPYHPHPIGILVLDTLQ